MMKKIEMSEMYKGEDLKSAIIDVIDSGRYIKGDQNRKFCEDFARFCNTKYAVAMNSGTSALILILKALGLRGGDEVIIPSHTFIATANAVVHAGGTPVFADIDEDTFAISADTIKSRITSKAKVIMPVHLYGHPFDFDPIKEIAIEHDLFIVEDSCQAHGALYKDKKVGSLGDASAFSFFPSKNMTVSGDGGAVTTNNEEIAEKISILLDQGRKKGQKYRHDSIGFNFRLSELHAAAGRVQLKHLEEWIEKRRQNAHYYNELLESLENIETPIEKKWAKHVYHQYVIRAKNRDGLVNYLKAQKIPSGIHYPIPVHRQPVYPTRETLPVTEKIADEILSLPVHQFMEKEQIEFIVTKIGEYFRR